MKFIERLEPNQAQLLKSHLQSILASECLDGPRTLIASIAAELDVDILECAAALVYLTQTGQSATLPLVAAKKTAVQPGIKMIRYRLDVGSQHQITLDDLKKVLVDESGVDKNNIANVSIRSLYTLIDLPDAMPPDIFQHLKTVEINQQKLDIRRVKMRNKKRGNLLNRRGKTRHHKPDV
ncbi:MAG: DbpA RNA binding domain-containing protein [Methylovulum sp.]|nr:DbpA RNA binding domain-containing protein [Methylovulum sp.]